MSRQSPVAASGAVSPWLLAACLATVYVIWGTTYFGVKVAIEGMAPFFLIGTRFLMAGTLLMALQIALGRALPTGRQWLGTVTLGFLLLVMGNGAVAIAEHWISSGATVALISVMPLMTALWSGLVGEWPRRAEWAAIVLGSIGAATMVMGRDLQASMLGTTIILIGIGSWSFGTVLARRLDVPHNATGFGAEMLSAGAMSLVISVALGEHWTLPQTARVWWAWGYLVVFGSLIGFSAYRFLVKRVSATLAATYAYVNPPVALLVGWKLGNESFSPHLLLGLPIVLASVGLHAFVHARLGSASVERPEKHDRPSRQRVAAVPGVSRDTVD